MPFIAPMPMPLPEPKLNDLAAPLLCERGLHAVERAQQAGVERVRPHVVGDRSSGMKPGERSGRFALPNASISATTESTADAVREATTTSTLAPSRAESIGITRPMPRPAPLR